MTADSNQNSTPAGAPGRDPRNRPATESASRSGRGKSWLFRITAMILAPVVCLALLELGLRLAGFGYPTGFLLPCSSAGRTIFVPNNQFSWRFLGPQLARLPEPFSIPRPKPPPMVRIFVFGESAAMGDPLAAFGLSRMLMALLSQRFPGAHFEVVNAAMTGINSHAILPIARDCARAEGDLWVIYMGNNEVVGPFGSGTIFGPKAPPLPLIRASLWLKSLRTGQLLDSLRESFLAPGRGKNDWNGMTMFLGQQVRADDPRMSRVYDHFQRNLADILNVGTKHGVGIVLSTVAVSLKDCPPLASAHRPDLSPAAQTEWDRLYALGGQAQDAGSNELAAARFQDAAKIDDRYAELRFRQGDCALALGRLAEARTQYVAARDLDTLRFRCDSRLNELIRQTAAGRERDRIRLADAEQVFARQSPDGLPGEDWFYEHVHLTFEGNYLLARTIADQLEKLLPSRVTERGARTPEWPSLADCARRLAWSDWSRAEALRQMLARVSQPPFPGQLHHAARLRHMQAALEKLAPALERDGINRAMEGCKQALATAPDDPHLYAQMTFLKLNAGDLAGAEPWAVRQTELWPGNPVGWSQLGMIRLKRGHLYDGLSAFDRSIEVDPRYLSGLIDRANVLAMLGQYDDAFRAYHLVLRLHPGYSVAWISLGDVYAHTGRKAEAQECYRKAVADNVDATLAAKLAGFCRSRGWLEAAATNYVEALKLEPINAGLHLAAGRNLMDLKRYGEAADQFREAARLKPESTQPRLLLGLALRQQGRDADALACFEEILRRDPANAPAEEYARPLRAKLGK